MDNKLFKSSDKVVIYTDGGSRGNPGPAGIGVVIGDKRYFEYIGRATNNVAEYKAVVFALKKAKSLLGKEKAKKAEIEVRMDSELVKKQLSGEYRIKENDLKILFADIHNIRFDLGKVEFVHIPREKNKEADKLANEAMDRGK